MSSAPVSDEGTVPKDVDLLAEFGRRVRKARGAAGISQEELGHRCGLHRTYISSLERGERNVGLLNILTVATVLEVEPAELLAGLVRLPRLE